MVGGLRRAQAGAMNNTAENPATDTRTEPEPQTPFQTSSRPVRLTRPVDDRIIAGVCAGFARYLNVDTTIVRVVLAVLTAMGGAGVPLYIAGWLLIPEEGHEQSLAAEFINGRQTRAL
jgi:phage shock protein PspC (stress-responsive transcriptional regulator)